MVKITENSEMVPILRKGDIVEFGSYPSEREKDEEILKRLKDAANPKPDINDDHGWVCDVYYNNAAECERFVYFKDIETEYGKYRAVHFSMMAGYFPEREEPFIDVQSGGVYEAGGTYMFKFEPLKWRVLNVSNGKALLHCDRITDTLSYLFNGRVLIDEDHAASAWEDSRIRNFLNGWFFETAFSDEEKKLIKEVSTQTDSVYKKETTLDRVFILNYRGVFNTKYGFSKGPEKCSSKRRKKGTEYTETLGLARERGHANANWWVRDIGKDLDIRFPRMYADAYGRIERGGEEGSRYIGVVPAVYIKANKAEEADLI